MSQSTPTVRAQVPRPLIRYYIGCYVIAAETLIAEGRIALHEDAEGREFAWSDELDVWMTENGWTRRPETLPRGGAQR